VEPNTVLRGALHPAVDRTLTPKAVEVFGRSATMRVVSLPDLYGGKLTVGGSSAQSRLSPSLYR
jgi:hypothetical protein